MCIFTGPVDVVSDTHVFARLDGERQLVAYEMKLTSDIETAMVLPVPVRPGSGDDALSFVSLEGYAGFFDELDDLFPSFAMFTLGAEAGAVAASAPTLMVHRVGSFEASFVPTPDDFARLDARFRLSAGVWEQLPAVRDHGFAVFQLRPGQQQRVHPMAYSFPTRWPDRIVFPTIHVHDGEVHPSAQFDHRLYCQLGEAGGNLSPGWEASLSPPGREMQERARGLVVSGEPCHRLVLAEEHPNEDWIVDLTDVRAAPPGGRPRPVEVVGEESQRACRELKQRALSCKACHETTRDFRLLVSFALRATTFECPSCGAENTAADLLEQD